MTSTRTASPRSLGLLLLLLVLQGLLVAHVFTPGTHPGGDNAAYVALADALAEGRGYVEGWEPGSPNHTKYPPVFAGLLAILVMLGAERWVTLKLVAAVSALVVVGATYLWARKRIPEGLAAGAALATGLSYTLLFHSRYILSDVPFLAFTMLTVWLLQPTRDDVCEVGTSPSEGPKHLPASLFAGAVLLVGLAYFTRSAGLPLVLALLAVLAVARAWRRAAVSAAVLGIPAVAWSLRTGSEQGEYGSEFLLVNPYEPALGTVDVSGMLARIGTNAEGYLTEHLPASVAGSGAPSWVVLLVLIVTLLALVGWGRAAWPRGESRPGLAELFLPLYAGVVLVWPEVWSGDRFALPLVPFLMVYALETLRWGARGLGESTAARAAVVAPTLLLVGLLTAAAPGVRTLGEEADACADLIVEQNAWTCSGVGTFELVDAARWTGAFLPEDAVVLSRKPRIFHVESGVPSRTYPFLDDPQALLDEADAVGARYVLLDRVSSQGMRFVGGAIVAHPERFCSIQSFSAAEGGSSELLGLLPAGRPSGTTAGQGGVRLAACPDSFRRAEFEVVADPRDRVPILLD